MQPAVVFDVAQLTKLVHKSTDPTAGCAYHFCQSLLGNLSDDFLWLLRFSVPSDQQQYAGQAFFTRIKKLVGQVFFEANIAFEHVSNKQVGELMFLMNHANHFLLLYSQHGGRFEGGGCGRTKRLACYATFTEKISRIQKGDDRFFPIRSNNCEFYAAVLNV
jgi:hypothetical protein